MRIIVPRQWEFDHRQASQSVPAFLLHHLTYVDTTPASIAYNELS